MGGEIELKLLSLLCSLTPEDWTGNLSWSWVKVGDRKRETDRICSIRNNMKGSEQDC